MPDNSQTNTKATTTPEPTTPPGTSSDVVVQPDLPSAKGTKPDAGDATTVAKAGDDLSIIADVASRVAEAHNILIALSSDPSVDEMAAAIGLSLALDRAGKRATAIYSGQTPNALEFLKPEDTFEASADTLQDFVIAINKDKADHLRYKLDGDFVKIFITPYKTRVSDDDLEFSYGDFNIDLVLALDVANGVDLDSALREHGRIMHDATVVNITTGNPGKFGEIEWSNKSASSVSEMATRLLMSMSRKLSIEADDATALLTGIIAATNRFSNSHTTPESMKIASDLLKFGANQQLITEHITDDIDNNFFTTPSLGSADFVKDRNDGESTSLDILHGDAEDKSSGEDEASQSEKPILEVPPELLELSASESSSANAETSPASTESSNLAPSESDAPSLGAPAELTATEQLAAPAETPSFSIPTTDSLATPSIPSEGDQDKPEKVVAPSADFATSSAPEGGNKYGQMLEEALAEISQPVATPQTAAPTPAVNAVPNPAAAPTNFGGMENPAASMAPIVSPEPEINGVPEMNFNTTGDILPPPPAPSIDANLPPMPDALPPELANPELVVSPSAATTAPATSATSEPSIPAPTNSGAFQIPGM